MENETHGQLFIIRKPKGPLDHVALYLPGHGVFENRFNDRPCWVSLEAFSQGAAVSLDPVPPEKADPGQVLERIDRILASGRRYGFLSYNCEHAMNEALSGKAVSLQVRAAFAAACLGLLSLVIL